MLAMHDIVLRAKEITARHDDDDDDFPLPPVVYVTLLREMLELFRQYIFQLEYITVI